MKRKITSLLAIAALLLTAACTKPENDRPAYIPDDEEEEGGSSGTGREFYIFDQWAAYKGKPDVMSPKCSRLLLAYESFVLEEDLETISPTKIETQSNIAKINGITTISADVEHWYSSRDAESIKAGLTEIFNLFKQNIPGCNVGNYGVPVMNLNVFRHGVKDWTEEQILERWLSDSRRRMPAAEVSDVLYPSLYTMNDDITQYEKDVRTTADYIRTNYPGKKIFAYVWPQYYNLHSSPKDLYQQVMPADQWTRVLEVCFENFDGVVLWCHGNGPDDQPIAWSDPGLQAIHAATLRFINSHYDDIAVASGSLVGDVEKEPTEFHIWGDLGFKNAPRNLLKYGLEPINIVKESSVSEPANAQNIKEPILSRIEHVAKNATLPVAFRQSSWIIDRSGVTSDGNGEEVKGATMKARFKSIHDTFKEHNQDVTLGYIGIGPTSLTTLANNNYATEFARKDSWLRYAAMPCRDLRQYADVLYPDVTLINDDLEYWKADTKSVLEEARYQNPGKKIYAAIGTCYSTKVEKFADALTPLKEETLLEALEFLYLRCDGIVFFDNTSDEMRADYSEDLGFMKGLARFYANHKSLIDATISTTVPETDDIPPFGDGGNTEGGENEGGENEGGENEGGENEGGDNPGGVVVVPGQNLIINGDFEEQIVPDDRKTAMYNTTLERIPRLTSFFDKNAQVKHPVMPSGTTVDDGEWFHRCNNAYWFWFTYVEDKTVTSSNTAYKPVAHSGNRSMALYAQNVEQGQTPYSNYVGKLEHLFSLAQRIALDDTKKYTLKFWWYAPELAWSASTGNNNIKKIYVGLVSSTGATAATDYTWKQSIDVSSKGVWTEASITIDLPAIIQANPGKSFNKAAIFFNILPEVDPETGNNIRTMINIDDVSLTLAE